MLDPNVIAALETHLREARNKQNRLISRLRELENEADLIREEIAELDNNAEQMSSTIDTLLQMMSLRAGVRKRGKSLPQRTNFPGYPNTDETRPKTYNAPGKIDGQCRKAKFDRISQSESGRSVAWQTISNRSATALPTERSRRRAHCF